MTEVMNYIIILCIDELVESSALIVPNTDGLLFKDAPQKFVSVLIDCLDLVNMEQCDPITVFADADTTAGYAFPSLHTRRAIA